MPVYDVECLGCGYVGLETLRISELDVWDLSAKCPGCAGEKPQFGRVIRSAPARQEKGNSLSGQLQSQKESFAKSGGLDAMKHKASQRSNQDQVAAARESVKRGEFEGF